MEKSAVSRPLFLVAALCLATQLQSATFFVRDPTSPNAATVLATSIVERGEFAVHAWPRSATTASGGEEPLRAYHLPAEPLLLSAAFRFIPPALTPYLHVPVTVLFVIAVAAAGLWAGGRTIGLLAGLLATFDPFVLAHGPVWDDAFLAAALEWTIIALIVNGVAGAGPSAPGSIRAFAIFGVIAVAAGTAALTRSSSAVVLGLVAVALVTRPAFRPVRTYGGVMIASLAVSLGAWGLRNHIVLGEFHVGSSHDGITLFESNYRTARPSLFRTGIAESYELEDLSPHFQAVAPMTELDANRYFTRQAIAYATAEPAGVLSTGALKVFSSLTGVNLGQSIATPRNLAAFAANVTLLAAGAWGWWWWMRSRGRREVDLLCYAGAILAIVTCLGLLAGPVGLRYRISAAPLLYLGAAATILEFRRARSTARPAIVGEPRRTASRRA